MEEERKRSPQADDEGEASQEQQLQQDQRNEDRVCKVHPIPRAGGGADPAVGLNPRAGDDSSKYRTGIP